MKIPNSFIYHSLKIKSPNNTPQYLNLLKAKLILFILFLLFQTSSHIQAQKLIDKHFYERSDTFNQKRLNALIIGGTTGYTTAVLLLNNVWYKDYPRSKFHFFDDNGEWLHADKIGHTVTAYTESLWAFEALRWAGVSNKKAAWYGMGVGSLYQLTIEILDGTSAQWGFSAGDFVANTSGCALFGFQQAAWGEQRFVLKVGNFPKKYDKTPLLQPDGSINSIYAMATKLYGNSYTQTFFKDYNALNWWFSANPRSFLKDSKFPSWLNIAFGYSAENVFGAYYNLPPANDMAQFPRYRQYLLSLDIDLTKLKPKSKFLKAFCKTFNFVKIPAPALEYNSLGKFKFHPIIF